MRIAPVQPIYPAVNHTRHKPKEQPSSHTLEEGFEKLLQKEIQKLK